MDAGEAAIERLLDGIPMLKETTAVLPTGYDAGVLAAWRDIGVVLDHGIETVEFRFRSSNRQFDVNYDAQVHSCIIERTRAPVSSQRTVEGRLLMADFNEPRTRCRIHPPTMSPVECEFDERLEDSVYENLRSFVRIRGEAEEDPETGRVRRLRIIEIEPLRDVTGVPEMVSEGFWQSRSVEQLAAEQGLDAPQDLGRLIGAGAVLWGSDEEFDEFVHGIEARRRESREHAAKR